MALAPRHRADETESGGTPSPASAAGALSVVRSIGRRRARALTEDQALVEQCRLALDAISLTIFRLSRAGGPVAVQSAGRFPSDSVVEVAAAGAVAARGALVSAPHPDHGESISAWSDAQETGLLVLFSERPARWQADFVGFLVDRLRAPHERRRDPDPQPPAPSIQVPDGVVLGESASTRTMLRQIESALATRLDVLLLGETGVGKEVVARMIHDSGPTADQPFLAIHCAAIPSTLLEARLFGVDDGLATEVDEQPGLFVAAGTGSLLLDEIGELELPLQAKLLRALEEREVLPVGGVRPRAFSARVLSTSNRSLRERVAAGAFRADLYYRLRRLELTVPPLRERQEDIPALVLELVRRAARRYRKRIAGVSTGALRHLVESPWPGNVRELHTAVETAVLSCLSGGSLESGHFPDRLGEPVGEESAASGSAAVRPAAPLPRVSSEHDQTLGERVEALERALVDETLQQTGGNKSEAARRLGITRQGLNLKLRRWRQADDPAASR